MSEQSISDNAVVLANVVARNITALTLGIISGIMLYNGITGWGWFLFGSIVLGSVTVTTKTDTLKVDSAT